MNQEARARTVVIHPKKATILHRQTGRMWLKMSIGPVGKVPIYRIVHGGDDHGSMGEHSQQHYEIGIVMLHEVILDPCSDMGLSCGVWMGCQHGGTVCIPYLDHQLRVFVANGTFSHLPPSFTRLMPRTGPPAFDNNLGPDFWRLCNWSETRSLAIRTTRTKRSGRRHLLYPIATSSLFKGHLVPSPSILAYGRIGGILSLG